MAVSSKMPMRSWTKTIRALIAPGQYTAGHYAQNKRLTSFIVTSFVVSTIIVINH